MSYLKTAVNAQTPDADGDITVNVEHLNDVTLTTPAAGQGLKYDGSGWINDDVTGSFDQLSYSVTSGAALGNLSAGYYTSIMTGFETPFFLAIRQKEAAVLMNITDTSNISVYKKQINVNSIYNVGFTVEANVNALMCVDLVHTEVDPAGTYVDVQWQTTTGTALGPIVRVISKEYNRQTIYGFISTTSQTIVGLKRIANSASFGVNQSTATRQECIFSAREVG
jgi:hypothetical protein